PRRHAAHRHAPPGPLHGDRRTGRPLPRRRRRRLRHRRRRSRLPAHPPPRRLRIPAAGERPLHHPRRRGLRPAVHLAGHPVVRRRPPRPRRTDHRRHLRRRGRHRQTRPARRVRARQAHPAGDVPHLQPPDRSRRLHRRPPHRAAAPPLLPRHGQHRQPADELHHALPGVRQAHRGVRLRLGRPAVVHLQRDAVGLPALRRTPRPDQRRHQARIRPAEVAAVKQVYRSTTGYVFGWIWVVFVAVNVVDLTLRYSGKPSMVALAVLGALTAVIYLVALRPATVFTEPGLVG